MRFWGILLFCLLLASAGIASAAIAATVVSNSDPVARDNAYRVHKGETLRRSAPAVLGNDQDPDGDKLSAARVSSPKHGKLRLRSGGSFVYIPNESYAGMDSFTYEANDGNGGTDTATVEITVWPITKPPLARNDAYGLLEDGTLTRSAPGLLRNDSEVDGRRLFTTKVSDPAHGTLNLSLDGSFVYTPDQDFNGEDSFIYKAADRTGRGDKGTVSISVDAVNDAPSFTKGLDHAVEEDAGAQSVSPWGTGISAGPDNEAGQNLTFEVTENSKPGLFAAGPSISQNGALTYTPADDENGQATIKVRLKDDGGTANGGDDTSDDQQFGITVNSVDDGPSVSVANNGPIDEGGSATITATATDVDSPGSSFSYEFDCDDDNTFEVGPQTGNTTSCSFDDDGDRAVNVRVTDGNGGEANGSTTVTVNNVVPTADGQSSVATDEDTAKTITLTGSDPADPLTFKITSLPDDGALYEGAGTNAADEIQPSDLPRTLAGNQVTYDPDANESGNDSFEFKANDGTVDSASATVSIQVNAVNDAPTVDTSDCCTAYTEGQTTPVEIDTGITVSDVDDTNIESATVKITSGHKPSDMLDVPSPPSGFTVNHVAGSDTLTITGTKTVAEYESLLRTVTFDTPSTSPGSSRTITFQVNDGEAANNLSNSATRGVSITEVNSAPVVTTSSGTTAFTEDGPAVAVDNALTVTDADSTDLAGATVQISSGFVDGQDDLLFDDQNGITGSVSDDTLTLSGSSSVANYQTALRSVRYDNTSDTPDTNQRTVSFQVDDGSSVSNFSNTATKDVSVAAANDAPVLANIESGALAYTENDSATVVTTATTVSDVDSSNFGTGTLTVDYTAGGTADDRLEIRNEGTGASQIGVSGSNVTYEGTTIGSFTGGSGTTPLVVTLDANADANATQALVRNITYQNVSDNPSTATRTVRFVLSDGDGGTSAPVNRNVSVTAVNDPPALAGIEPGALGYTENEAAKLITSALTVTDPDSNITGATVTIGTNFAPSEDVLDVVTFISQLGITGTYNAATGVLTLTGSASPADYQTALRTVKYRNSSDDPSTLTRNVTLQVKDGPAADNLSDTQSRDVTVTAVNDAPTADNETFGGTSRAIGNTSLVINETTDSAPDPTGPQKTVTGDILDGDTDVDGPGALTVTGAGTDGSNGQTTGGGQITVQPDGDFIYQPEPGCADTTDTFKYTVSDGHSPTPGTAQGTVTVSIADCVWYVDDSAPAGGNGRSHSPYQTLASIDGAGGAGDVDSSGDKIFLYDGIYSGGLPLENNQSLFTEKHGLVVSDGGAGNLTLEPNDGSGSTLNGGLAAASGNNVQGLNLGTTGSSSVYALSGTSVGTFTMNNVTGGDLNNPAGGAINIAGTGNALNFQFGTLSSSGSSGNAVSILNASGTVSGQSGTLSNATGTTVNLNGGSLDFTLNGAVSDDAGQLISISNKTSGTTDFNGSVDDVTATPNNGGGISLQSNGTALTRFDGGVNLSTGSANAISASSGGSLAIPDPAAASNKIATTTGTALNVTNTTISSDDLTFESISANGAPSGIVLNNTGTSGNLSVTGNGGVCTIATPTCSGGTIQSTTGGGISLTNTSSPSFNLVRVLNTAGHGISGTTTSGLSLSNSLVQGAGDADNEAGLFFASVDGTNLTGNSSITNTVVNAPADVGAFIQNYGGTLNLTVSGSTFSDTSNPVGQPGDDLLRMISDRTNSGSATITARITGSTFKDSGSDDILANAQSSTGSGGGTMNLTVDGNTFDGNGVLETCDTVGCNSFGIVTQGTQGATIRYTIQNNTIVNHLDSAIAARSDNSSNVQGVIKNNTIGTAGSPRSGSYRDRGIYLVSDDSSDFIASVENNVIHSTFFEGISASTTDGTGLSPKMDLTILGNTTPTPHDTSGTVFGSIGMTASGNASACARAENNTAQPGRGGGGSIDFLLFRDTATSTATFQLQGLPAPTADASSFVKSKNPASADPVFAVAGKDGSNPTTPQFTGGTCRTPAATPTP